MLSDAGPYGVYLACGFTDMRKSIVGLAALVQEMFELDPFSCSWYVFCNVSPLRRVPSARLLKTATS